MSTLAETIDFPVEPLEDLHRKNGGNEDGMTEAAVSQLVTSLRAVGVSAKCIEYYFIEAVSKVKEEEI